MLGFSAQIVVKLSMVEKKPCFLVTLKAILLWYLVYKQSLVYLHVTGCTHNINLLSLSLVDAIQLNDFSYNRGTVMDILRFSS